MGPGRNAGGGTNIVGSQSVSVSVANIRRNYTYPAWFENTLTWASDGTISEADFNNSVDNLSNQGLLKLKRTTTTPGNTTTPVSNGWSKSQIEQIMIDYYGDDIAQLHGTSQSLGDQMNINWDKSQAQRDRIDAEIIKGANERQLFHDMHLDQETRITRNAENIGKKSDRGHTHKNGGDEDCGWFGEKCWFPEFEIPTWLKLLGAAIGIGLLLWLIRPLLKIGANVTK